MWIVRKNLDLVLQKTRNISATKATQLMSLRNIIAEDYCLLGYIVV
jgi:hypothetical protein